MVQKNKNKKPQQCLIGIDGYFRIRISVNVFDLYCPIEISVVVPKRKIMLVDQIVTKN